MNTERNKDLAKYVFLFAISRLFAGVEAEDEYYRILFIVLKTRLADIGRRIQYSLYCFNIKIKCQPQDLAKKKYMIDIEQSKYLQHWKECHL